VTIPDLIFLASVFTCLILLLRLGVLALRKKWAKCRNTALTLISFVIAYSIVLITLAFAMPRRFVPPGERKCFDDWCISIARIEHQTGSTLCPGASDVWVANIEVASVARRVQQRASDASAEIEDVAGHRYQPCGATGTHTLRDMLAPGESFPVRLAYVLPAGARPAGIVLHHGAFPGVIIVGADQSWLHTPTLLRAEIR